MSVMRDVLRYKQAQLRAGVAVEAIPPYPLDRDTARVVLHELRSTLTMPLMFGAMAALEAATMIEEVLAGTRTLEDVVPRLTVHGIRLRLTTEADDGSICNDVRG